MLVGRSALSYAGPMGAAQSLDVERLIRSARQGHIVALGTIYVDHGPDWCELAFDYDRRLISDLTTGVLASGPIVSLMDTAAGVAVALRRGGEMGLTLDLRVDYLRPARPGRRVFGRCTCYRLTRAIAFVRGQAHDGDPDDPIAYVAGSFFAKEAGA